MTSAADPPPARPLPADPLPADPLPRDGRRRWLDTGAVRLHVVEAGPADGPPVVLLHGFPEFWWSWRHQLPALAAAGYRAVAPDLRGYHHSDKPRPLGAYRLDRLAGDLRALLDDLGGGPHPVVGHDWGGALAWWGAQIFPERISRLAVLNAPHPAVMRRALRRDPDQRRRSRYLFWFQLPWLPERALGRDRCALVRRTLERTSRPGTFSAAELDRYAAAASVPGALRGMLAWYRAALRRPAPRPPHRWVEPPVRIVWGTADRALSPELVEPTAARCRSAEIVRLDGASHWVQHEEPARVGELLLDFLAR